MSKIINLDNLSAVFQAVKDKVLSPLMTNITNLWTRVQSIDNKVTELRNWRTQDTHQIAVNNTNITKLQTKVDDEAASLFKILCNSAGIQGPIVSEYDTNQMVYCISEVEVTNAQAKAALLLGDKLPDRLSDLANELADLKINLPPANDEPLIWDSTFAGSNIETALLTPKSRIGPACFAGCANLTMVRAANWMNIEHLNTRGTMPEAMVEGGTTAFFGCENLYKLVGKVQLGIEEAQLDDTLSEYLDLSSCPNFGVECFEQFAEFSDVTEANFEEYMDVKVWLHDEALQAFMSEYGEDGAITLKEKHIVVCGPDGSPLVA